MTDFEILTGKTLISIAGATVGSESIVFTTSDGEKFEMYHSNDCCESVEVEDIDGDIADLIGSPIVIADDAESDSNITPPGCPELGDESWTWTFYRMATIKGWVVIRWYGSSNGYYSESVSFRKA